MSVERRLVEGKPFVPSAKPTRKDVKVGLVYNLASDTPLSSVQVKVLDISYLKERSFYCQVLDGSGEYKTRHVPEDWIADEAC